MLRNKPHKGAVARSLTLGVISTSNNSVGRTLSLNSSTRFLSSSSCHHSFINQPRFLFAAPSTNTTHSQEIIPSDKILARRSYARRVINTSDTKVNVIKQYWETHGKKYLKYGILGIIGLPFAIVGGIGYGAFALVRAAFNRIRGLSAGSAVGEWTGGAKQEKSKKKPGMFAKMLNNAIETELSVRLRCLQILNEHPEVLEKLGPVELDQDRDDPEGADVTTDNKFCFNTLAFYVKSPVSGRTALVRGLAKQSMKEFDKFLSEPNREIPDTIDKMDKRLSELAQTWSFENLRLELDDTGEELVLFVDGVAVGDDKKQQKKKPKTVEEIIEIEIEEELAESPKKKKSTVIDVPFKAE